MAEHTIITEPIQYKKNVVVLPTAYLKDESSANLRMFLRKENSGTTFFIGNDPSNNALRLPYNVPCHNNNNANTDEDRTQDEAGTVAPFNGKPIKGPADAYKADKNIGYDGFYNRAGPIGTSDCISWDDTMEAIKETIMATLAYDSTGGNFPANYNDLEDVINLYNRYIDSANNAAILTPNTSFITRGTTNPLRDTIGDRRRLKEEITTLHNSIKEKFIKLANQNDDTKDYTPAAHANKRKLYHAKRRGYFNSHEIAGNNLVVSILRDVLQDNTVTTNIGNLVTLVGGAPFADNDINDQVINNYMAVIRLRASQYASIRDFCPDLRCVARVDGIEGNADKKVTNSGDHTSNFRIYLPNYENNSELEGCYFEFIIVCNNSILEDDARVAGGGGGANLSEPVAGNGEEPINQGKLHNDRYGGIGSANIEIISHSYITQMYDKFRETKEFNQAFPLPCKYTPYIDDPLTTKTYIRQLLKGDGADNYALPNDYGFSKKPDALPVNLTTENVDLNYNENIENIYGIHADFRPTHNQAANTNRTIEDRLYSQGKTIENNKIIAGVKFDGRDLTLSQFFNIYKNALNDTTDENPSLSSVNNYNDNANKNKTNEYVKKEFNFQKINITNNSLVRKEQSPKTYSNFINKNGAGRGVVDKRNIFADNVTTSYNPDEPCYGIDINPEEQYLAHRHANMVGTINCRGSIEFSRGASQTGTMNTGTGSNTNPGTNRLGDIKGQEVKDGLNEIIPVYNTLKHNDKGDDYSCGLGTPCDEAKPFHTIHINLNRLKYQEHNTDNSYPQGNANAIAQNIVAGVSNNLKALLTDIPQANHADNNNDDNYNSMANRSHTSEKAIKSLLKNAVNKPFNNDAASPLNDAGNPGSLFGLHNKNDGKGVGDNAAAAANLRARCPAPPLHHPKMRPFGTAGGGAGNEEFYDDTTPNANPKTPKLITTNENSYADHRQSCVNKQIHIKCHYLDGMWRVEVITPNVHTLGGNQLLHQNPGFRDITFVRGRR